MSKAPTKIDTPYQTTIFDFLKSQKENSAAAQRRDEGRMACADRLRSTIRQAIRDSGFSRHQIAGQMSHLCGETITKAQIDSWTRKSDALNGHPTRYIPAEYLPAFCAATNTREPIVLLGQMIELFVLPGPEALRAEIQRLKETSRKTNKEIRRRKTLLEEMESRI